MTDDTQALGGEGSRPTLAGRYEIRGSLGQGGMADVMLAHDRQLDREVAVKILHARYADDPAFLARFRREAQAAASLTHPNIVAVYDAGEERSRPFIVMEHVRGRSLSDVVKRERIDSDRALRIVGDAAMGLHYAHERGLIHRDIKPGNILVSEDGQTKVADFGIARAIDAENVTQTATVFGTAAYVAPEQAQGRDVDRRTDVYALGCVLYELLTGRQPFTADTAVALAYKHVSEMPRPPSEVNPDLSPELDAIVFKAMAKNPDDRYATAREMGGDLQRAAAGAPVAAPPAAAWAATQALGGDRTAVLAPTATTDAPIGGAQDTTYAEEEERSSRGLWLVLLAIIVLAIFALAGVLLANLLTDRPVEVAVPNVIDMPVGEAEETLRDAGLVPIVDEQEEPSDTIASGRVARTEPDPDTPVEEGEEVRLFVSSGTATLEVPDVSGDTSEDAQEELLDAGFGVGPIERVPHDDVDEGLVIRTDPPAGSMAERGANISLIVSTGPDTVRMPSVVGEEEADAERILAEACSPRPCLTVEVEYEESDDVAEGLVIEQDPEAGRDVERDSTVEIVVSEGSSEVRLPDVRNQSEGLAIDRLERACDPRPCVRVRVERAFSDSVREGRVIDQDPGADSEVDRGSEVTITVSDGPEPTDDDGGDGDGDGGGGDGGDGDGGGGNGDGNGDGDGNDEPPGQDDPPPDDPPGQD